MPKKKEVQKFLSGIVADGKVTKAEAKAAQDRGIKLDRIQGAYTKSFQPGNPFSSARNIRTGMLAQTRGTPGLYPRQTFTPPELNIRPGAQKLIGRDTATRAAQAVAGAPAPTAPTTPTGPGPAPGPGDGGGDDLGGIINFDDTTGQPPGTELPGSQGPNVEELLSGQIAAMQNMFTQSIQQQQQQFMEMQMAQNQRMEALQQQMGQSMKDMMAMQQTRPEVAGVKMAEGMGGTPMQIARRGVTGAFNRRGMRISSLNV